MPEAVFLILIHWNAFGFSKAIPPDDDSYRVAYASEALCKAAARTLHVKVPEFARLEGVRCHRFEVKR